MADSDKELGTKRALRKMECALPLLRRGAESLTSRCSELCNEAP